MLRPSVKSSPPKQVARKTAAGGAITPPGGGPVLFKGNVADVIKVMRHGISAQVILDVAGKLGISQDSLFESLNLPKSTMKARISKDQSLSNTEQDRMYRANRVWQRTVAVLEDEAAARTWISRPNRALGGEAPLTLLDTEAGYELVLDTLGRIEYGVVA